MYLGDINAKNEANSIKFNRTNIGDVFRRTNYLGCANMRGDSTIFVKMTSMRAGVNLKLKDQQLGKQE